MDHRSVPGPAISFANLRWNCGIILFFLRFVRQVTLTTFAVYVLTDPDHVLEANKAFVSLALFNLIRCPMNMFPTLVATFVQVKTHF